MVTINCCSLCTCVAIAIAIDHVIIENGKQNEHEMSNQFKKDTCAHVYVFVPHFVIVEVVMREFNLLILDTHVITNVIVLKL